MRPLKRLLFFTTCLFPVVIAHTAEPSFKEWNDVTFIARSSGVLALDVIRPDDDETRPAVVCLHGGFWVKGTRKHIRPLAVDLAKLGYVGICSSYRLSGVAPFPAQIEDVRAAIRFLRENASAYGIDPERIGVVGSSAGGHLAVLAATDNRSAPAERPNAAVGMGAQTDLTAPHIQNVDSGVGAENWSKFLGGLYPEVPENYASASPLAHLSGDDPAIAIVCGELDQESTRAERFRQAAFRLGIPTALTVVPDGPHGLIHGEDHRQAAVAAIDRFFQINLGPNRHGTVPMVVQAEEGKSLGFEAVSPFWTRIGGGYGGCEGAQWFDPGNGRKPELIFAAHHDHLLFRWSENAGLRLWEDGTAEMSTLRPNVGGFYAVEQQTRRLVWKPWKPGPVKVIAEDFEGKRFNRPNDLRVRPGRATVWFTDPAFLFKQRPLETQELEGQFVFRFDPDSGLTAPIRDLGIPNGIAFSPSGEHLFIGDSKVRSVIRFPVSNDGEVGEPTKIITFKSGLDGLATDPLGHLWCALADAVAVITPDGEELGRLLLPGRCTSIDFIAQDDHHLVAVTTREATHVARFRFEP